MAEFDGMPVLQPREWFAEEAVSEFSGEEAEKVVLEFGLRMQAIEKTKRLSREWLEDG